MKIVFEQSIQSVFLELGYTDLLPIQNDLIPYLLNRRDCLVRSRTGSGKTAAYCIPIIQNILADEKDPQALILAPTRELALQIQKECDIWGIHKKIKSVCLVGKQPYNFQKMDLAQRCHIVTGTPGRVLEHLEQGDLKTDRIHYVVVDEADEMFNQDFKETIAQIFSFLPHQKTVCFVSATLNETVKEMASIWMHDPKYIVSQEKSTGIQEYKVMVQDQDSFGTVAKLLVQIHPEACIVFCQTQKRVDDLYFYLKGFHANVERLHAGLSQEQRLASIQAFQEGQVRILVASDVASRGLDIEKVALIVNADKPESKTIYTHRIGRSARVHEKGIAVTCLVKKDPIYDHLPEFVLHDFPVDDKNMSVLQGGNRMVQNKMKQVRKKIVKLYINIGKKKKVRAGDIVGAICDISGMKIEDIGIIQVQDQQSYVDILHGKETLVLTQLKRIKNKQVKVEVAHS